MSKSPALFNLINSLTQSEKRYFKRYANIHSNDTSDKKYMQIFEEIEKLDHYDGLLVMRKMGWDQTRKAHYSEKKNYLYNLILKSLRASHTNMVKYELRGYQTDIDILIEKGLFKDALKRLHKAKKLADKYHYDEIALELALVERTLSRKMTKRKPLEKAQEHQQICDTYFQQIKTKLELLTHYENIFIEFRNLKGGLVQALQNQYEQSLNIYESSEKSYYANYYYYLINGVYYRAIDNIELAYQAWKDLLEMINNESHLIDEMQVRYIGIINNYLGFSRDLNKYEDRTNWANKLQTQKMDVASKAFFFQTFYNSELKYLVESNKTEKAILLVPMLEDGLRKYRKNINDSSKITIFYNVCMCYATIGVYEKAHDWCGKIMYMKSDQRQEVQNAARLINILFHFHFKNYTFIESLVRSTRNYLRNKRGLNEYRKEVLRLFQKAANLDDNSREIALNELKTIFQKYDMNEHLSLSIFEEWFNNR